MNNQSPQLNPGTFLSSLAFRGGLDAARFGSTNTAIAYFTGAATVGGLGISETTAAQSGSEFTIDRPGVYQVSLFLTNAGAAPALAGISLNTDNAGLTAAVTLAVAGMEVVQAAAGQDVPGNAAPLSLSFPLAVTAADIAAGVANGDAGAVMRIHASGAGIVTGSGVLAIHRVASLF